MEDGIAEVDRAAGPLEPVLWVARAVRRTTRPELFFAIRGGKGMLGIVTAIEFDLVHQPMFYGGSLWFDGTDAPTVIEQWRAWSDDLPELGTTFSALFQLPEMPGVPAELAAGSRCRCAMCGPAKPRRGSGASPRSVGPLR